MLRHYLYEAQQAVSEGGTTDVVVTLLPECEIYRAHFPGMPITPGVCLVQIAKELIEDIEKCRLHISQAKDIKFISIVTPGDTPQLHYSLTPQDSVAEAGETKWSVCVTASDVLYCKMSLVLKSL